jgi:hypothetical protein
MAALELKRHDEANWIGRRHARNWLGILEDECIGVKVAINAGLVFLYTSESNAARVFTCINVEYIAIAYWTKGKFVFMHKWLSRIEGLEWGVSIGRSFMLSELGGNEWSLWRLGRYTVRKFGHGKHYAVDWDVPRATLKIKKKKKKKNPSVALSPRANYTDWSTATCRRNLMSTFVDRGVSRGQRGGSPTVVNLSFLDRSRYFYFK